MTNRTRRLEAAPSSRHHTSAVDWLYAIWVALLVASTWTFLGAPLLIALASRFTRLRESRGQQTSMWVIASLITVFSALPALTVWLGWSTTQVDEQRFVVG